MIVALILQNIDFVTDLFTICSPLQNLIPSKMITDFVMFYQYLHYTGSLLIKSLKHGSQFYDILKCWNFNFGVFHWVWN